MTAPYVRTVLEDQSTRVVGNTGVYAGIVIKAKKGPVNTPYLVTSQTDLLRVFTPNERIEIGWDMAYYSAYYYLREGNRLWVVRACDLTTAKYGGCVIKTTDGSANEAFATGITDPSDDADDDASDNYSFDTDDAFIIYGSSVGAWNNDIGIRIITDQAQVKLENAFIIEVYKNLSGSAENLTGTRVERFTVSLDPTLRNGYGVNCYIENVLEGSNYIRAEVNDAAIEAGKYIPLAQTKILQLKGGEDSASDDLSAERVTALHTLENTNDINLSIIMDGGYTDATYHNEMIDVCTARDETTFAVCSMPYGYSVDADNINKMLDYRNSEWNPNSYLASLYAPHQEMYDEFNDRNIYVDPATFVAGRIAVVAEDYGWHWPVAGYNRGIVNTLDVAATFTTGQLDILSDAQINVIIKDPGSGNVIFDQLTTQAQASDLQEQPTSLYLNVYLRPALRDLLKTYLFELNDEETRMIITKKIDVFMQAEKASRACYEYRIVCDETNNLADDIENNRLNVWLYIKPMKYAKFLEQRIIVTPYAVNLESIEI